ncbi:MAG: hypothetical protein RJA61_61 [Candidatus Parcubacteria bacterium]
MKWFRTNGSTLLVLFLLISNIFIFYILFASQRSGLTVSFLNIGQGDAIFIQTPSGKDILIDGGKNKEVLKELGGVMSFFDRHIDMVIATHPDLDHIGGFPGVFDRYRVDTLVEPGVFCDKSICTALEERAVQEKSKRIQALRGTVFDFGDGVFLTILFPDRDVMDLETNTASVVARLIYGTNSLLLTGDSPISIENFLVWKDGTNLNSDILKAGHHGSRTSSSEEFVRMVSPAISVISAGKGNSYGHPHKEVVDILTKAQSKILGTYEEGRINLVSDGKNWSVK